MKKCPKCGTKISLLDLIIFNYSAKLECRNCHSHLKFKTIPYSIFIVSLVAVVGFVLVQYAYPSMGYFTLVMLSGLLINNLLLLFFPIEVKNS